jgi:hypothetical protein
MVPVDSSTTTVAGEEGVTSRSSMAASDCTTSRPARLRLMVRGSATWPRHSPACR